MECLKPKRRTPKHGDNLAPAESRVRLDSDAEDDVLPSPRHPRLKRQPTSIEQALKQYNPGATLKISQLQAVPFSEMERIGKSVLPSEIQGSLFVGHLATDMDSIGSAIAAAELLEGIATRASEINPETEFVLDYWKIPVPPPFEAVWEEHKHSADAKVCLVDHNQKSQMNAAIPMGRVRGVIDHHALQAGTLVTDIPVYMNIRPWGSACTILGHMFLTANRLPSEKAAAVLLSGILSDTLNLQSPTTTDVDRSMVAVLGQLAGVTDVNGYAKLMFKAKSKDLLTLSATTLLAGDLKRFQFNDTIIAFAVIETTDVGGLLARVPELLDELRAYKAEHNLSFAFCALVDIINISSQLIVSSAGERQLAEHVFGGRTDLSTNLLDLGKRVSRKKDYIPPLSTAIAGGWKYVPEPEQKQEAPPVQYGEVYMDCSEHGCQLKRRPSQLLSSLGNLVVAMSAHSHQHEPRPSKIASPPIPESPRQGGDAEPAIPSN